MRFGIFYEHQLARPWEEGAEASLLSDALEQVELADRVGIDYVWEVEHHFLEEYAHSSAPEVFLAAASQRTERIRLGHGIVQLPPAFNHPFRVAERIATLDLISGGRVEFGTGEGSAAAELEAFGIDREAKRDQWRESLDAITRMMVEEPFAGHRGPFLDLPQRNVVPKPAQKPHPPLWVACSRRETIRLAARTGIGALTFAFVEPEDAAEWVEEYYRILAGDECVPAGYAVNPNLAVVLPMMLHADEQIAIERGIDGAHFFGYSLAHYYIFGEHRPARTNLWEEFLENRDRYGFARQIVNAEGGPLGVKLLEQGLGSLRGAIGTPDQVGELLRRYERAGVDQVVFVLQAGHNRHEHICESIELFAKEVLPDFAERGEAAERAKAQRLAPAVEAAVARRPPPPAADPDYVILPATVAQQGESRPPPTAGAERNGRPRAEPRAAIERIVRRGGEAALGRLVNGADEDALERRFGRPGVQRALLGAMARQFDPQAAAGWSGDIEYLLRGRRGERAWTVSVNGERAKLRPGPAAAPQVTISMSVPDFARISARAEPSGKLMLEGRLRIEGDLEIAGRLAEMFGGPSPW